MLQAKVVLRLSLGLKAGCKNSEHFIDASATDGSTVLETLLTQPSVCVWDLLDDYLASSAYRRLAPSTQKEYARVAAHVGTEIGHTTSTELTRAFVRRTRQRWTELGHRAASLRLQLLKNAATPLIQDDLLPTNLFDHLGKVAGPGNGVEPHPVWRASEFSAVIDACAHLPGLVRALALARYNGFRREDLCRLPNDARFRSSAGVRFRWKTGKSSAVIEHLEDPRLTRILDTTAQVGSTIAYNRSGGAWKPRQLAQALQRVLGRLEAKGLVRPGLTWHGLRHLRGVELAEAGCSDAIIMAQLGHTTDRSAKLYRRQASRRTLGDVGQQLINTRLAEIQAPASAERSLG